MELELALLAQCNMRNMLGFNVKDFLFTPRLLQEAGDLPGHIGIMEKNMETTISGLGLRGL